MVHFNKRALKCIESLEDDFATLAFHLFRNGRSVPESKNVRDRRMIGWIGATSETLARAWYLLEKDGEYIMPRGATKERFLYGLLLLKNYDTDENNAARCGSIDEKTFRKWAWWFLEELTNIEDVVVSRIIVILFSVQLFFTPPFEFCFLCR